MSGTVCHVTVVHDRQALDVALPAHAPLADLLPTLLHLLFPTGQPQVPSDAWALTPVGADAVHYGSTLTDAGVTDGAVLTLAPAAHTPPPARLEHLLDVIADHVDTGPGRWHRRATAELTATAAALLPLVALWLLPALRLATPATITALTGTALALVAAAIATAPPTGQSREGQSAAPVGSAILLTSAASYAAWTAALAFSTGGLTAPPAAAAGAAAAIGAVIARGMRRNLHGPALLIAAYTTPVASAWSLTDPAGPAAVAFAAVLTLGVLPRIIAGAGGLAALDYRLRHTGRVAAADVTVAVDRSASLLTWTLTGLSAAITTLAVSAASSGLRWPLILAALLGAATAIRARLFTRIGHVLPPAIAGLGILTTCGLIVVATVEPAVQPVVWAAAVALLCLAALIGARGLRAATVARLRLAAGILEATAIIAAVPVLAATLGLFDLLAEALR